MTQLREHTVGDVVAERFELLDRLGVGGMGTVWRARDSLVVGIKAAMTVAEIRTRRASSGVRPED